MAYLPKKLAQSAPANTTETTVYTVGTGLSCIVKQVIVANVTAAAATLDLSLVPSGGTAGDGNRVVKGQSFPANSTTTLDVVQVLAAGDFLSLKQGTASALTVTISGVEFAAGPATVKDIETKSRSSGNLTLNSTAWANVDTALDIALNAATGDVVEVGLSGVAASEATVLGLDAATLVSGAVVTVVSSGAAESATSEGVMAWRPTESTTSNCGGSVLYTLQATDISLGTVTLRLRYRTGTAANKTLNANSNQRLVFWAINHGAAASAASEVQLFTAKSTTDSSTGFSPASPTSDTLVPNMTVTVSASQSARTAVVSSVIVYTKTNDLRFKVYLDGVAAISGTNGLARSGITDAANQSYWTVAGVVVVIPGDGASHTIDVRAQASGDTGAATFNYRSLAAQVHRD